MFAFWYNLDMIRGLKYRLYPTLEQEVLLAKAFGCARHSYNWSIEQRRTAYANGEKTPSRFDLNVRMTQHKRELSTRLVRENQAIAVEDLNVSGMLRNHSLAGAISDASWGEFFRMLEYKCEWYGVHLMKCGRFEPTSKTCSECGHRMGRMPLSVRSWVCPECGTVHDRDVNAAKNILSAASVEYGRGGQVSPRLQQRGTARRSVKPPASAVG